MTKLEEACHALLKAWADGFAIGDEISAIRRILFAPPAPTTETRECCEATRERCRNVALFEHAHGTNGLGIAQAIADIRLDLPPRDRERATASAETTETREAKCACGCGCGLPSPFATCNRCVAGEHKPPATASAEDGAAKREWHGCTDRRGHSFEEGVCADCGWDLRLPSERPAKSEPATATTAELTPGSVEYVPPEIDARAIRSAVANIRSAMNSDINLRTSTEYLIKEACDEIAAALASGSCCSRSARAAAEAESRATRMEMAIRRALSDEACTWREVSEILEAALPSAAKGE